MAKKLSILLVEDSEKDAERLVEKIRKSGYPTDWHRVESAETLEASLTNIEWDIIFVDYVLPGFGGMEALEIVVQKAPDTPVVVVSDEIGGEDVVVEIMRAGARDYIDQGNYTRLIPIIEREMRDTKIRQEKREAENALRESEMRYRTLVEVTPVAVAVYCDSGILFVNQACSNLIGAKDASELIGRSHFHFVHPDYRKLVRERAQQAWEKFLPPTELKIICLSGEEIEVEVVSGPIQYQGRPAVIVTLVDISERKNTRRLLSRRAVQLQVAAEVARDATAARDVDELLNRSVTLIRDRFDFYHAGIFLVDDQNKFAVLAAAPGEVGEELLATGHKLEIGKVGIVGTVAGTGQPRIALDVGADAVHFKQPLLPETRSEMALPLMLGDRVIGVLDVQSRREAAFDEQDVQVLQTMADQLAVAIDKAHLFSEVQRRAYELSGLYDTALATSSALDTDVLLTRLYEQVQRMIVPDSFLVALYEEPSDEVTVVVAMESGEPVHSFVGKYLPVSEGGLTGWVIRHRKTLMFHDLLEDTLPVNPIYAPSYEKKMRSWLGVPLIVQERVLGVVSIQSFQPHAFDDDQRIFFETLAAQAAIALDNAGLFSTLEKRAVELDTERRRISLLYEIGRALTQSLNPEKILEQAVILTCRALDGASSVALLYDSDLRLLNPIAAYDREKDALVREEVVLPLGEGLAGWVVQEKQPAFVKNIDEDRRWRQVAKTDRDMLSAIAAPIVDGANVIGTLSVHHREKDAFTKDHLHLLEAICQQVALAYSNAKRYQEINRLVDRLAAEQYRLESLIKELPIGILLFDEKYHLLTANSLGQEYLAHLSAGNVGDQVSQLGSFTLPDLLARQDDPLPIEIAVGESPRFRFEVQSNSVIGGTAEEYLIMIRDVTREREITERSRMQDRLATVGQLAAGIAHDFNNIMAAIVIYTDLLKTDANLSDVSRDRLLVIQRQVQRAASLIRQILDFSRRSVMEQTEVDLLPFMKEIERLLQRMLPETIQTQLEYHPGTYTVFVDPTRIQQVLMNLAVNARDAMPEGGVLQFELDRLQLEDGDEMPMIYLTPGEWIRLAITDTGEGISPENLQRVFEPFFTTKGVGKGTGLGLAQVYGIVKQHGGYIDVESQVGIGTTFHIYLPTLRELVEEANGEAETILFDGQGQIVLLAEDDPATRSAVCAMLEACHFKVITALNGLDAYKILESGSTNIELVVSDVVMPQMGGVALYEKMQKKWPAIKILFITGHPLEGKAGELLSRSEIIWLQKPFSVLEFQQALQRIYEQ